MTAAQQSHISHVVYMRQKRKARDALKLQRIYGTICVRVAHLALMHLRVQRSAVCRQKIATILKHIRTNTHMHDAGLRNI